MDALLAAYPDLIVVIDAGPLLLSAESAAVVSRAGGVVMVVRSGVSTRAAVKDAISRIPPEVPAGLLLNAWERAPFVDAESYYSNYYSYEA